MAFNVQESAVFSQECLNNLPTVGGPHFLPPGCFAPSHCPPPPPAYASDHNNDVLQHFTNIHKYNISAHLLDIHLTFL